ncbi:carboxypeptidase regulatory-like domain-containing protein, partial [Streptomonospora salina]|uniref:carboxypeptidase regulatory-like domain-containing protein n=1 Tax=Streptomonospora salina TaxID=104205 RepID=UPI0035EF8B7D
RGDAAVRGRVMRVQGAPGAHCLLRARAPSRPVPDPETAAVTDARGRYAWSLPAATYTLWARCGAAEGRVEGVEAVAGRTVRADIVVE